MNKWFLRLAVGVAFVMTASTMTLLAATYAPDIATIYSAPTIAGVPHRIPGAVGLCPSMDGTTTAVACSMAKYAAPTTLATVTANNAVTAIAANQMTHGCIIKNPVGATTIYFSLTATATAAETGGTLSLTGGSEWRCPYGTAQALSVVSTDATHSFVAIAF